MSYPVFEWALDPHTRAKMGRSSGRRMPFLTPSLLHNLFCLSMLSDHSTPHPKIDSQLPLMYNAVLHSRGSKGFVKSTFQTIPQFLGDSPSGSKLRWLALHTTSYINRSLRGWTAPRGVHPSPAITYQHSPFALSSIGGRDARGGLHNRWNKS